MVYCALLCKKAIWRLTIGIDEAKVPLSELRLSCAGADAVCSFVTAILQRKRRLKEEHSQGEGRYRSRGSEEANSGRT